MSFIKIDFLLLILIFALGLSSTHLFCQVQKPIIEKARNQDTLKMVRYESFKVPAPQKVEFIKNRYKAEVSEPVPISFQELDLINDPAFKFEDLEVSIEVVPAGYPILTKASKPSRKIDASYDIRYLNQDHGMPTLNILSIFKDSKGMLWMSIRNGGIIRYDGQYFAEYGVEQGFRGKWIRGIHEDKAGNMWFSDDKLSSFAIKYDGNTFSYYSYDGSMGDYFPDIAENKNGDLFFASGKGLIIFNGLEFRRGFKNQYIFNIAFDGQNRLWIHGKYGLYWLKENNLHRLDKGEFLKDQEFSSLLVGSKDEIWFSIKDASNRYKLLKLHHDSIISIDNPELFRDQYLNMGDVGIDGAPWIYGSNGLIKFDGAYFEHISQNEGMTFDRGMSLVIESSGAILLSGFLTGLNILRESVINYSGSPGFNKVESIFTDSHNRVWIGIRHIGIYSLDGSDLYKYSILPEKNYKVNQIFEDFKGRVWFNSWYAGALCLDGDSVIRYDLPEGAQGVLNSISEQANGDIWFGTLRAGLYKFDGQSFVHYNIRGYDNPNVNYLHVNNIYSSLVDADDRVWFATSEGIAVYKDGKFEDYSTKIDLKGAAPYALFEDITGNIWIGTNGDGLFKFDGIKTSNYTIDDGLASNKIEALSGSGQGGIWIGTTSGVNFIDDENLVKDEPVKPLIKTFNGNEGMRGLTVFTNAMTEDNEGNLWVGTSESLTRLSPPIKTNIKAPLVTLLSVDYQNVRIDQYNTKNDSTDVVDASLYRNPPYYNVPVELSIPYELNRLNFKFTAIDWAGPYDIQFQTQLVGLDKDWNPMSTSSEKNYSMLPYGNYIFKIRAIGHKGVWSKAATFPFTVHPPWWHTWWARIIYGFLFVAFMFGIVRIRTSVLIRQKKRLEDEVEKRTLELKKTQSQLIQSEKMASLGQLTAGIAHEINNPVSFTQTSSFALAQDVKDITELIEKYRSYIQNSKEGLNEIKEFEKSIDYKFLIKEINQSIEDIKEGTKRTSKIVKGLREFSHIDSEQMEPADIHHGIDTTLNLLKNKFIEGVKLSKNYDQSIGLINCHIGQLNQVFMNLLVNALYAIKEKGEIVITTKDQDDNVLISIEDNGSGIPEELINKTFDPFFTTKKVGEGMGLGLSISHGIIKLHRGIISVKSTPEKGTRFDILLPRS